MASAPTPTSSSTPPRSCAASNTPSGSPAGGAQALGQPAPGLAVGARADLLCLNSHHPALVGRSGDALLDGWIFAGAPGIVAAVWRNGVKVVRQGRHKDGEAIGARYRQTLEKLLA